MEKVFTLSACCMSENDELVLQSLINIIDLRSNAHWSFSAGDSANVLIVDVDSNEGRQFWTGLGSSRQDKIAIAYGANREGLGENVKYLLDKPLRSKKVLDLLEQVSNQKLKSIGISESSGSTYAGDGHRRKFVQKIKELFDSGAWGIRYKGQMLIINGTAREAYTVGSLSDLSYLAEAPEISMEISELSHADVISAKERLNAFKFEEVIWYFSRFHSNNLISDLAGNKQYKIRRWPNLKKIQYQKEDVRLLGMLMKNWMSMEGMAQSEEEKNIVGMLNALYMTGFLQLRESQDNKMQMNMQEEGENKGLYSRIRRRLGIA
jgi:hypothetical protein